MNEEYGESSTNDEEEEEEHTNPNENLSNDNYVSWNAPTQDKHDYGAISGKYEIEPEKLEIFKAIGEGYYSDVHMGLLSLPIGNIPVAVKTAKTKTGAMNAEESEDIRKRQRQILCDSGWADNFQSRREKDLITTSDLLWFALQIARAMEFLAAKNILHRDAAVRNVLLKLDFTAKVADFGLSRKLRENDDGYYIGKEGTAIPILYIAPESLKSGRFAITSEYWSFGVVVWELFTFAEKKPYSELDHYENNEQFYEFLVQHLSSGKRLSIPDNVPRQM
uniref:Protein kinase domain-containing protein n=1 Tax=Plectus sambesii TaxID=2011161 RepID=A0A914WQX1_9BILA